MAAAAASAAAAVADLGTAENVTVAVRIRPLNAKEASEAQAQVWRPLPGVSGHMQLYTDKGEPVPKQTYAYGAWVWVSVWRVVTQTGCGCVTTHVRPPPPPPRPPISIPSSLSLQTTCLTRA